MTKTYLLGNSCVAGTIWKFLRLVLSPSINLTKGLQPRYQAVRLYLGAILHC